MRSGTRLVLGLAVLVGLGAALPSAASASAVPTTAVSTAVAQTWGSYGSSDWKAWAWGRSSLSSSGLRVTGYLYDSPRTRACSWVKVRSLSDRLTYRTVTFKNCSSSAPRTFRVNAGYALKSEAKLCRGTSTRITGKCSGWRLIWRQGG
ncbi:hypothetical protein [Microbispora sp. NPDC046933]|uniref:hypothetical protein n=1 Tax=Microbispora sp. NPDC046933 TaxID=3155618 RepID=UPI0033D66813